MDLDKPAIVQSRILLDRLQNLEDELAHNEEMLRRFKIQNGPEFQHDIRMTEREISTLKEKLMLFVLPITDSVMMNLVVCRCLLQIMLLMMMMVQVHC